MTRQATRLRRLPPSDEGRARYLHPGGYVLVKERRDWSLGGMTRGAQFQRSPLEWWSAYEHPGHSVDDPTYRPWAYRPGRSVKEEERLRDLRAWCDEHPRKGWGQS